MSGKGIEMDNFEKIEKLVEKTGISYGEAKRVLEQANGDLLDAMIILESEGKAQAPRSSTYSTQYEEQTQYVSVPMQVESTMEDDSVRVRLKRVIKKVWHFLRTNSVIARNKAGEVVFNLPLWGAAIILLMFWWITVILLVVSLFVGFKYEFVGEADLEKVNQIIDKASSAADKVKDEYNKL